MKKLILSILVLVLITLFLTPAFSYEKWHGGLRTVISLDTLLAADTTEGNFQMLFTNEMAGEYYLDYFITNLNGNTKWKLYHVYGNDTTAMVDTVLVDSLQAEKNGSLAAKLKAAYYHQWYAVSFGAGNDSITVEATVNAAQLPSSRR